MRVLCVEEMSALQYQEAIMRPGHYIAWNIIVDDTLHL